MFTDYPVSTTSINMSQSLPWLLIERQRQLIRLGENGRAYPKADYIARRFSTRQGAENAMVKATMREEKDIRCGRSKRKSPRIRYIAKATLVVDGRQWNRSVSMLFNTID